MKLRTTTAIVAVLATAGAIAQERTVGTSPWGERDQIGRVNLVTADKVGS